MSFNFRSFVATAVLAATSVVGTAVQAQPGYQSLIKALDNAGVSYSAGECASHNITGTYGFYVPSENHIHICTDVATEEAQQYETLRHEAVHAAQRCVHPSMAFTINSSQYLLSNGLQSHWSFIQEAYDQEDWAIELEAFTLMSRSNSEIAALVNSVCN